MLITSTGNPSPYAPMLQAYGNSKDDSGGSTAPSNILREQARTAAIGAAENHARSWVTEKLSGLLGPFGVAASLVIDCAEDSIRSAKILDSHFEGVKKLAGKNIPGIIYRNVSIEGTSYEIAIDASSQIENPNNVPFILIKEHLGSAPSSTSPGTIVEGQTITSYLDALKNMATSQIAEYRHNWEASLGKRTQDYAKALINFANSMSRNPNNNTQPPPENHLGIAASYGDLLVEAIKLPPTSPPATSLVASPGVRQP